MRKKIFLLAVLLLSVGMLNATIINVPADYSTIQAGIDTATDGDTVLVQPGTYVENINYNGKNITVASLFLTTADTSYISQTVIDGDSLDSVVKFISGEDSTAVLCGFAITNGFAEIPYEYGGGIYCTQSSCPVLSNLIIFSNYSEGTGGGISCRNGSNPYIQDSKIYDNSANHFGGGLSCYNASPLISNVVISNNFAEFWGGAIYCCLNSTLEINDSYFFENISYGNAGCILCEDSNISIKNSVIKNSDAFSYGGALFINDSSYVRMDSVSLMNNVSSVGGGINIEISTLDIYNCFFYNNSACDGGAIISFNSDLNIYNSVFVENGTYEGGSAIDARNSSDVFCCNVIITDNYAQTSCGGIKCDSNSNVDIYNSILWNDTQPEIIGTNVSIVYSDIQGGWIGTGNINSDPLFADTLSEDYHLSQDSPCIDKGITDTTGLDIPPWDMDGNKRVWDGNGDGIAIIDMGAYEYGAPSYSIHEPDILQESMIYNYPNPIKNSTTIKYSLKQNSNVKISIYNIRGQLISTPVNEDKPKGEHSIIYNTEKLNSGVYFYKLEAGELTEIKKFVVIK